MKITVSRDRIAKAFRFARRHIGGTGDFYICHTLLRYEHTDWAAAWAAVQIIHTRMGRPPAGTPRSDFALGDWLRMRGYAAPWAGSPVMISYRKRWLDVLIKEFSA